MVESGIVKIQGLAELALRLDQLPDKLAKNVLVGAVRAAGRVMQKEARKLAPIAAVPHALRQKKGEKITVQPGWLRKNISLWRVRDRKTAHSVEFKMGLRAPNKGPLAYYGLFVERGTRKAKAQPYMRPAFDTQKEAAIDAMKKYLSGRIDKELNK